MAYCVNNEDTVKVALRIRPLSQKETERGCDECIHVVPGENQVKVKDLAFTYNYVFPQYITQQEFYETAVEHLIGKLFQVSSFQSKDPSHEERRTKTSALEAKISELKKNCQQQAQLINKRKENEANIAALNAELESMKEAKMKIIKNMREDCEKFCQWKSDNDRATAIAKIETLHEKQENVLKRKMEEAVAVNIRLKEALKAQKPLEMKRNAKGSENADAVQEYIERELEVHLSILEAENSLEELMEYRAYITEKIEDLRYSTDDDANRKNIAELEDDLALRKAQISDLQQRILTADQENKSRTRWNNIQSMHEAKLALNCLFELLIDTKRELYSQSEKGYQARYEEIKVARDSLMVEMENTNIEFERHLAMQNEQQVKILLALQQGVFSRRDKSEASKHPQNVIQSPQDRLELLEQENKNLADELEQPLSAEIKMEPIEEEEDEFADSDKDPDWNLLLKRIRAHRSRHSMNVTGSLRTLKKGSDGNLHCTCQGFCSTKMCGCVLSELRCGNACRCQPARCSNRDASAVSYSGENEDTSNRPSSSETSAPDTTPQSYYDEEGRLIATHIKKKKGYFFSPPD